MELEFLYGLTVEHYSGEGIIVDAGVLLGASTVCFGMAVEKHESSKSRYQKPIVAIDRAIATPNLPRFLDKSIHDTTFKEGDSFQDQLERSIAGLRHLVDLRIGDLLDVGQVMTPIEFLFLDILKTRSLSEYALSSYYPLLIPGKSLVIHQDYFADTLPHIREHHEALSTHFRYVGEVGSTAIFLCVRRISAASAKAAVRRAGLKERLRRLSIAEQRSIDPYRRLMCGLSRVWVLAEEGEPAGARACLDGLRASYDPSFITHLPRIKQAFEAAEYLCDKPFHEDSFRYAEFITSGQRHLTTS